MAFLKFVESKGFQSRFNFIRDLLVIAGIALTGLSLFFAAAALRDTQKVNSAQFVLNMSHNLNEDRYQNIALAIMGDEL